ncbi:cyclophilin-like fold protein [Maribellus mangrovi]|uniref:cyclophilin-like fold protein n=1 Tax=Maribellus mangrovi TaxID=3133146 RepID=UPI0030ED4693
MSTKFKILLIAIVFLTAQVSAQETQITITVNGQSELTATLVDNSSVAALIELLQEAPLTIEMRDYANMEKVGPLGTTLPRNDQQITTKPGDIILYQGNALVIYYAPNSWNFTRLGKIDNVTQEQLKAVLGEGDVTVTLELADPTTDIKRLNKNDFQVYPNPTENSVKVSGEFEKITLLDSNGREMLETMEADIDLSTLKSGIYFLKIELGNDEPVVKKVVKN